MENYTVCITLSFLDSVDAEDQIDAEMKIDALMDAMSDKEFGEYIARCMKNRYSGIRIDAEEK